MSRAVSGAGIAPAGPRLAAVIAHTIGSGQSLSVGVGENPSPIKPQPFWNLSIFDSGLAYNPTLPNAPTLSFVPLTNPMARGLTQTGAAYALNQVGITAETLAANAITALSFGRGIPFQILASCIGISGAAMNLIQKGGGALSYAAGVFEAQVGARLATAAGKLYYPRSVLWTHGEADATGLNTAYQAELVAYQANMQADCKAFATTKFARGMPLICSEQNSFPGNFYTPFGAGQPLCGNITGNAMLAAALGSLGNLSALIVATIPKYHLPQFDGVHLTEYERLGDKYAQADLATDLYLAGRGNPWLPCYMLSAARLGASITVQIHVPFGPLVFDTLLGAGVGPHQAGQWSMWGPGKGFEVYEVLGNVIAASGSPIVVTLDAPHNRSSGDTVGISGVDSPAAVGAGTNTHANGVFVVDVVSPTQLSLRGTTSNGTFGTPGNCCAPIGITGASINGSSVTLTLARSSASSKLFVGYADQGDQAYGVTAAGPAFGGRYGLVRDSDPGIRFNSNAPNYNWLWGGAIGVA